MTFFYINRMYYQNSCYEGPKKICQHFEYEAVYRYYYDGIIIKLYFKKNVILKMYSIGFYT